MRVVACIFDGFHLIGFLVENSKGKIRKANYNNLVSYVKKGKVDGLTYREIDGEDFLVGLNFQELAILNFKEFNVVLQDDKFFVNNDGTLVEIPDNELWDYCVRDNLDNRIQIGLDFSCGGVKVLDILDGSDV